MESVYPLLPDLWERRSLKSPARVLVPLCGNSPDLHWLAEQGHSVIGIDVSAKALQQVMQEQSAKFSKDSSHGFTIYRSERMELWEGDFLKLPISKIPALDLIYDKAAIVALPPDMRADFAQKVLQLCNQGTQMLVQAFEYEQHEMSGPPFSVDTDEINSHYNHRFSIDLMHEQSKLEDMGKFQQRGLSSYFIEKVYHLLPIHHSS
jgi:thiopurine S-methyltransferase